MKNKTFTDIINQWPSLAELSRDIDVDYEIVKKWRPLNTIPAKYWQSVILAASNRGYNITAHDLVKIAATRDMAA